MENQQRILPENIARVNWQISTYAEIAIENYQAAKKLKNFMEEQGYKVERIGNVFSEFIKKSMITVVFSAMAIESFVNDYAATCLGDDFFYENFEKLSVFGKLQIIVKFLFKQELDKSISCYSNLKTVFSCRDKLVHSKSESIEKYIQKSGLSFGEKEISASFNEIEELTVDLTELKESMKLCEQAIKAMQDLAYFFDERDQNSQAIFFFFQLSNVQEIENEAILETIKEFKIKKIGSKK